MSTVAEMINELDAYGFADEEVEIKLAKLQAVIWEIEGLEPWPFLQTSLMLDFNGTSDIPSNWPTNFRAALRLKDLVGKRRIFPIRLDDFEDQVGIEHSKAGDPTLYYFEGLQLKVWPIPPASTGRMKLRYWRYSDPIAYDTLESGILIPKWHHEVLVVGALLRLYLLEDDVELAQGFKNQYDELLTKMRSALLVQQLDQADYIHAVDPEEWDYHTWN